MLPKYLLFLVVFFPLAVTVLFLYYLRLPLSRPGKERKLSSLSILLLIQTVSLLLSTLLSVSPGVSWHGSSARGMGTLAFAAIIALFWTVTAIFHNHQRLLTMLRVMAVTGFFLSVHGILQHLYPGFVHFEASFGERVYGSIGNPEFYANLLLYSIFLNLGLLAAARRPAARLFYLCSFAAGVTAILLSHTRGAWAGLLLGGGLLLYLYWLRVKQRKKTVKPLLKGLALMLLLALAALGMLRATGLQESLQARVTDTFSARVRLLLWRDSMALVRQSPVFGSGHEAFRVAFTPLKSMELARLEPGLNYDNPHNNYLAFLINYGLLGFLAYIGSIIIALRSLLRAASSAAGGPISFLWATVAASFIGVLAHNLVNFDILPTFIYFYIYLGLAAAAEGLNEGEALSEPPRKNVMDASARTGKEKYRLPAMALAVVLILLAGTLNYTAVYNKYMGGHLARVAERAALQGDTAGALRAAEAAVVRDPGSGSRWYELAESSFRLAEKSDHSQQQRLLRQVITAAERALPIFDNPESVCNLMAAAYENMGDDRRALQYYMESISKDPNFAETMNMLSRLLLRRGEYQASFDLATRALSIEPENLDAHASRCAAALQLGLSAVAAEEGLYIRKKAEGDSALSALAEAACNAAGKPLK